MADISAKIFQKEIEFVAGASLPTNLPKLFLPQVAFLGKSNVGKSSLINRVCRRKALARVSHTPGRTRQINFFTVDKKFILADFPGYGFARVPDQMRNTWQKLILAYFQKEYNLRIINILIDGRHGVKENDEQILAMISSMGYNMQVIFTKSDKSSSIGDKEKVTSSLYEAYPQVKSIVWSSSKTGVGIKEIQKNILQAL
jgi:GTP-binding protein